MPKLTKRRLESLLTRRLKLRNPEFQLHSDVMGRLFGSVIAQKFRGLGDADRLDLVWKAVESELGKEGAKQVGMLLAYTPGEWYMNYDAIGIPRPVRAKSNGRHRARAAA